MEGRKRTLGAVKKWRPIRLSKSVIGEAEKQAVMRVLDHEYLGMGQEVFNFETQLSNFFGRPAVCVANGTAALHLSLQAIGLKDGHEVLVPSLTYVSSFQAISATGAAPVACDIDLATLTIDWKDAESRITNKTKAIMPVHYAGGVGKLSEVYAFASNNGLRVIEDAAHAFGTIYRGKRVGAFGDISCFSFDGIKNITSGEGGCVVSSDTKILNTVRDCRLLGVVNDTEKRFKGQRSWHFNVHDQGWRYHMSNLMAAIGVEQLKKFPAFKAARQAIAIQYDNYFRGMPTLEIVRQNYCDVVPHIYPLILNSHFDRETVRTELLNLGVPTGVHYMPNHLLTKYITANKFFPALDSVSERILTLPIHPDLDSDDVGFIANSVLAATNAK